MSGTPDLQIAPSEEPQKPAGPSRERDRQRHDNRNANNNRPSIGHKVAALERSRNEMALELARLHQRQDRVERDDRIFKLLETMNTNLEHALDRAEPKQNHDVLRPIADVVLGLSIVFLGVVVLRA